MLEPGAEGGIGRLRLRKGPVFTNMLLGDEINRAPAKTQSALLEVMQERQVTLEGQTMLLPRPFMVLATQNPIDSEGTYPLPEAQRDRFLFKIDIGFPSQAEEVDVVKAATGHQVGDALPLDGVRRCLTEADVIRIQDSVGEVRIDDRVVDYAVRLARATRGAVGLGQGAGSRGAIALVRAARAAALIQGRDFATPDDVKRQVLPALRHRVMLAPDAQLEGRHVDELLRELVARVDAPRL
jgi:MoxR-like ATPase